MHRHTVYLKNRLRSAVRGTPGDAAPGKRRAETIAAIAPQEADAMSMQGLRQALADFSAALHAQRSALAGEVAQASVELAIQIAERLLGVEIASNRQRLDQIVLTSLERIQAARSISVMANPLDLHLLQRQLSENAIPDRYSELLSFQRDETCPRGRLKLETDELFIEWDTQRSLAEIRNALLEEIHSEAAIP